MRIICRSFKHALASVLFIALSSFGQQSLDLRRALSTAEAGNLELRAARQQRALSLAGITTARQLPNPVVGFTAARDTPHEGISIDLPIEIGGQRGKRIVVAREEQKSTEIDIAILDRQIRRRTRDAFFRSLGARAQTAQAKVALDLSTRVRDLVQQRYNVGDVAQLDVLQAEVELAKSTADFETTEQAQRSADATLSALLNRSLNEPLSLSGAVDELPQTPSLDQITAEAMKSNSDLAKTAQDLATEERRLRLVRAQRIPTIDVTAGADFNSPPDFRAGGRGGLTLTLPLLYHGQGEVALSSARVELLHLTLASERTNVGAQVAAAYFDYTAKAHQALQYRGRIVPQSIRIEEMAEESYKAGKTNVLTLIDAQRRLNDVQKAYIDSMIAAQSSFATLEETVGVPLD